MEQVDALAAELGELLKARKETVAVAESSSGGLISAALLSVPGASSYYLGGAVVYAGKARMVLMDLARQDGVTLYAINYKDRPQAARRFLAELGNPFSRIGADRAGRVAIDWGVYGVPETYVVDGKGKIEGAQTVSHIGERTRPAVAHRADEGRKARSQPIAASGVVLIGGVQGQ